MPIISLENVLFTLIFFSVFYNQMVIKLLNVVSVLLRLEVVFFLLLTWWWHDGQLCTKLIMFQWTLLLGEELFYILLESVCSFEVFFYLFSKKMLIYILFLEAMSNFSSIVTLIPDSASSWEVSLLFFFQICSSIHISFCMILYRMHKEL